MRGSSTLLVRSNSYLIMSESNYNWVCFECRFVIRQAKTYKRIPKCHFCNQDCICVGYKLKIPKKSNKKEWEQLKKINREIELQHIQSQRSYKKDRITHLSNEIKKLSSKEENKDRTKLIDSMKKELDQLLKLRK